MMALYEYLKTYDPRIDALYIMNAEFADASARAAMFESIKTTMADNNLATEPELDHLMYTARASANAFAFDESYTGRTDI